MRQMATKELLRRAALATPMIGGLSILGLLALSVAKGPDRPDAVVGSTTTAKPGAAVEQPADEVAAAGDTVTADEPAGEGRAGSSDSDSVGSDGDGGGSGSGNDIAAGDERRRPESVADPAGDDRHRPRHERPEHSDDDGSDEPDRHEPSGSDTIEIAGGLPYSGNDRHDGGVSANVNLDPVNVSINANTGRPPAARTSTADHHGRPNTRTNRPSDHKPSDSGHKGVSVGARTPSVVLPLPGADPVPGPDTEIHPVPSRRSGAPKTPTEIPDDAFGRGLRRGDSIIDRLGHSIDDDDENDEAPTPGEEPEAPPAKHGGGSLLERLGRSTNDDDVPDDEATPPPEGEPPADKPAPQLPPANDDEVPEEEAVPGPETPAPPPKAQAQPPQVADKPPAEEVVPEPEEVVEEEPPVSDWRQVAEPEPQPEPEPEPEPEVQEEEPVAEPEPEPAPQEFQPGLYRPDLDPTAIEETELPVETPAS
jgi:hypothetical protein